MSSILCLIRLNYEVGLQRLSLFIARYRFYGYMSSLFYLFIVCKSMLTDKSIGLGAGLNKKSVQKTALNPTFNLSKSVSNHVKLIFSVQLSIPKWASNDLKLMKVSCPSLVLQNNSDVQIP